MRKILLVVAVVAACVIGFSLWKLRTVVSRSVIEIAEAVAKDSGAKVSTGAVSLSVFPPSVEVREVSVVASAGDGSESRIFAAPRVRVTPKLLPVLFGQVHVSEAVAESPTILVRRKRGKKGLEYELPVDAGSLPGAPTFPFSIRDATITFEDRAVAPTRFIEIEGVDLDLDPPTDEGSWPFKLRAAAFGEVSSLEAGGTIAPGVGPTGGSALEIEFEIEDALPEQFFQAFPMFEGAPLVGEIDLKGTVSGLLGEVATENAPAEPLEIRLSGSSGLVFADRPDHLEIDVEASLDDKSLRIVKGAVRWAHVPLALTGYFGTGPERKVSLRLIAEKADVAKTLAGFGVPERWQPRAMLDGTLRVTGSMREPMLRYDASAPEVEFDGLTILPVRATDVSVNGSALSIAADISGSFQAEDLRVADAKVEQARFGIIYWRDMIRVAQRQLPMWGGKVDIAIGYRPPEESLQGGGFVENLDAAELAANVVPGLGLKMTGGTDSIFQVGFDARGPWVLGRIGVHHGKLEGWTLARDAIAAVLDARSKSDSLASLATAYRKTLSEKALNYRRLAFDFESREEGVALRALDVDLGEAEFQGEGVIDYGKVVALWGNLVLGPTLSNDLAAAAPAVSALIAADGRLRIPLKLQGPSSAVKVSVDDRFLDALNASARGEATGPFVPMEPSSTIVTDLPSLDEQFYR